MADAPFQDRVQPWMMACFGADISSDRVERADRLLEEVFELLQSGGYDPVRVLSLRDYVWGREIGEPAQEVGGVMVTLAAYCLAHGLDMHQAGEAELARIWTKVDQIRAKQAAKPKHSPLPQAGDAAAPMEWPEFLATLRANREARKESVYASDKVYALLDQYEAVVDALLRRQQARDGARVPAADQIIGEIEERFPNWRGYRDLIDCIDCTLYDLRSALRTSAPVGQQPDRPTHRHVKRGKEYVLLGIGKMQAKTWEEVDQDGHFVRDVDMSEVAIYRSVDDGSLWARPREEFEDGRFDALCTSAPVGKEQAGGAAPVAMECHGLDTPERVCFYEQDFYVLSNFSSFQIEWTSNWRFPTSEHVYHWLKFATGFDLLDAGGVDAAAVAKQIQVAPSAHEAFKIAERHKDLRRPDWDAVKVDFMRKVLRAKARQHEYVRRKLLSTGDRELVENSWRDDFWGWGPNRDGENMLGKLWMELRAEIRASEASHG